MRDADGIVVGGIRTPPVDVPVAVLRRAPARRSRRLPAPRHAPPRSTPSSSPPATPSVDDYLAAYEAAADAAVEAGFVLAEDREALLDVADPSTLGG